MNQTSRLCRFAPEFVQNPESACILNEQVTITLSDVAKLAGVSPATVSRCINEPQSVRQERREKVQKAIDELGYVPHGAARALASNRTRLIGAVFPSLDTTLFGGMLEALQGEIAKAGYTLVIASSNYDAEKEYNDVRTLLSSGIDALTLVGGARSPRTYEIIQRQGIPYVLNWVSTADNDRPCVGFDNHAAVMKVTKYLLDLGHKRFGMISGMIDNNDRATMRLNGVRDALREHGLELDPSCVVQRRFGVEEGREAFRLLMSMANPPTAIICGSDPFAYGSIFEASEMGLDIPDDVSVTGFDDMWLASQIRPSLTTVQTPRREIGVEVGRYLLAKLTGNQVVQPVSLDTKLIVRDSTGPAQI